VVCVFARHTSAPLASLVEALDTQVARYNGLKSFVVVLTDDAGKTARALEAMASDHHVTNVPLTLLENIAGPPSYKIAKGAEVTVMMWRGAEIRVNHAYAASGLKEADIKTIVGEIPKLFR
jgi:hypothetical protein